MSRSLPRNGIHKYLHLLGISEGNLRELDVGCWMRQKFSGPESKLIDPEKAIYGVQLFFQAHSSTIIRASFPTLQLT